MSSASFLKITRARIKEKLIKIKGPIQTRRIKTKLTNKLSQKGDLKLTNQSHYLVQFYFCLVV
jgi:hypothetical protein